MSDPTQFPLRDFRYPAVGADAILAGAARSFGARDALVDGDQRLSFAELHDAALRVAAGLRERGIAPGETVSLHLPNSLWFVVAYYGALLAGAAVAPVNPAQPPAALKAQLEGSKARAVFTHPGNSAALATAGPQGVRLVVTLPGTASAPAPADVELPEDWQPLDALLAAEPLAGEALAPELVAHLQLTGGTTGRSKGVRVLHRNLVANVLQMTSDRSSSVPELDEGGGLRLRHVPGLDRYRIPLGEGVFVAVAPLFHGLGLVSLNMYVLQGSTVHFQGGRFAPDRFLADIERLGVTQLSGSPAMFYALLRSPRLTEYDLSSVRVITSGAAPIDTTALAQLRKAFTEASVNEGYGLSEATMGLTAAPLERDAVIPTGTVGRAVMDTELEIRSPEDGATVLATGSVGEIWARGPQIADGYQDEPELTAHQFIDGWLRTGDMGRLDEDGYLFLVGRAKDMLIYKGYNVYPQPLEELLCSHPAVAQAAVVGRADPEVGEIPVAFVVTRPGASAEGLEEQLIAHVGERVAPYQRVREVRIVDALPLTPTGKILKTELRERLDHPLD